VEATPRGLTTGTNQLPSAKMQLWHGPIGEFVSDARAGSLAPAMLRSFYTLHGYQPGPPEVRSWEHSLGALSDAVASLESHNIGVVVEYHLPYSNQRIDAVFIGKNTAGSAQALVTELKQWSHVELEDKFALNVLVDGVERAHPCQQALDYAGCLSEVHSAFVSDRLRARSCSYCHNLLPANAAPLKAKQFQNLIRESPLFKKGDEERLGEYVRKEAGNGDGMTLMREYATGKFQPSKKLLEVLEATIKQSDEWHLLGRQREAYNAVFAAVRRLHGKRGRAAVLVKGGPGTGKSVIAIQLMADTLRLGLSAMHVTGGKAFTTTLRSKFKGAEPLFGWNLYTRNVPPQSIDLLLVDEAHRVRETSDTRFTQTRERGQKSQMQELLDCSKVTVFLLDENQYVRPDEVGSSDLVRETTQTLGVPLREFDLHTQFRCGGCIEYATWVDYLLGFVEEKPKPWGLLYHFQLVNRPTDLDKMMAAAKSNGERARITAGFCWKWSSPKPDGSLVEDVQIGSWLRPWNAKRSPKKRYKPENDPYTLWAETDAGEWQIGCIYSAQGFEFDRVGIIWGPDLVWRKDNWVAQLEYTYDPPLKPASVNDQRQRLIRNAYRVLLTRAMREAVLLCLDAETKAHVAEVLQGMQL
jgi:hypothetical protein